MLLGPRPHASLSVISKLKERTSIANGHGFSTRPEGNSALRPHTVFQANSESVAIVTTQNALRNLFAP